MKPSGLACELVLPDEWAEHGGDDVFARQFARTPYAVSSKSGGQTSILVTLHVLYGATSGDRVHELRWLAAGWPRGPTECASTGRT